MITKKQFSNTFYITGLVKEIFIMDNQKKNRSGLKKALSVVLMGTVCLTAAISVASLSKTVTVTDGEKAMTINTTNPDTNAILEKTGIVLGDNDKLVRTDDGSNGVNISILRGVTMDTVNKDQTNMKLRESKTTEPFFAAGMTISKNDADSLASAAEVSTIETEIKLARNKITVDFRGEKIEKEVPAGTVKEALDYLNIQLDKSDLIEVDLNDVVENGMKIVIKKVEYKNVTTKETIDYEVITRDTETLFEGESMVETEGVEGERTIVTKEKYVNGKLDSTELVSTEVTKEPINKVVLNGTAEKVSIVESNYGTVTDNESTQTLTDMNGNEIKYTQVLRGPATAYYAPAGAGTATGRLARYGVVAVDPDEIPYGSILYIVSDDGFVYGYAVAGDTGGFIYYTDVLVDLYFPTYDDCCNFGLRNVSVYVLEGVSEDATYN